ncbi:MAG TPA: hypothetical protein VFA27_03950 [Vicinamibacterales bacterium]|nr:hypothetical protein [Vicinamibacterales bacterium]
MDTGRANRYSTVAVHVVSFTALLPALLVYVRALTTGHLAPPPRDEGAGAHLFQLSLVLLLPAGVAFLASADWSRPARVLRRLVVPAIFIVAAFVLLYYYEHVAVF